MIRLYDYPLSGDCYKVRLLLGALGLEYVTQNIDFHPGREHRSSWFLAINPLGRLPVLEDNGVVLRDAQAILVYLSAKYDNDKGWYPRDTAERMAQIALWLAFAQEISALVSAVRLPNITSDDCDVSGSRQAVHHLFRVLEEHLWFAEQEGQNWICSQNHPTIADVACFPDIMLSEEAGISRQDYPAIRRWTDRIRRIPGFVLISGVFPVEPQA